MGHTLTEWQAKVAAIMNDAAGRDTRPADVATVGIVPALREHSAHHPRRLVVEVVGNGTGWFALPSGWVDGVSYVTDVEYPVGQNPPNLLGPFCSDVLPSPGDVTIEQIVLLGRSPATGEPVRIFYAGLWPTPTSVAADDKLGDVEYEGVAHLAAALCLESLAVEAGRGLAASLPTDGVDGANRSPRLAEAAQRCRAQYDRLVPARFVVA